MGRCDGRFGVVLGGERRRSRTRPESHDHGHGERYCEDTTTGPHRIGIQNTRHRRHASAMSHPLKVGWSSSGVCHSTVWLVSSQDSKTVTPVTVSTRPVTLTERTGSEMESGETR